MPLDPINWPLVYHNAVCVVFLATSVCLAFFVLFKNPLRSVNITFFGLTYSTAIIYATHLIGVNTGNIFLADAALQWNLIIVPLVAFNNHLVFAVLGKEWQQRYWIASVYLLATVLTVFFITYPRLFLDMPVPKMYFNYYYVPGEFYWLMRVYQNIIPVYFLTHLVLAFRGSVGILRARLRYFLIGLCYGYTASVFILPLMYDIEINPMYAMTFGLYTVFFAYAILKYELLSIRVLAKRALLYFFLIVAVSFMIISANYFSDLAADRFEGFPAWAVPLLSGVVSVFIGYLVWRKIKEVDALKYEFVNVVTHKFRTPLTHIKWVAETIAGTEKLDEARELAKQIKSADNRLIELTNILIEGTDVENKNYRYRFSSLSINELFKETEEPYVQFGKNYGVKFINDLPDGLPHIFADKQRIMSVFQIVLENAFTYAKKSGGEVRLTAMASKASVTIQIKDTGIGIANFDMGRVFSKFFRTKEATKIDTEGIGIGLFIAKQIVIRHGGKIWIESEGEGMGTTVFIRLKRS
ncbi:MAG: ATP-binding protein [bacterium]|nr:ATP-binding protein [bacterium]